MHNTTDTKEKKKNKKRATFVVGSVHDIKAAEIQKGNFIFPSPLVMLRKLFRSIRGRDVNGEQDHSFFFPLFNLLRLPFPLICRLPIGRFGRYNRATDYLTVPNDYRPATIAAASGVDILRKRKSGSGIRE